MRVSVFVSQPAAGPEPSLSLCTHSTCWPPQVTVDNETYDDRTIITVDSANRPGTLVEVVQCLTELGLNVKKARISSDGG